MHQHLTHNQNQGFESLDNPLSLTPNPMNNIIWIISQCLISFPLPPLCLCRPSPHSRHRRRCQLFTCIAVVNSFSSEHRSVNMIYMLVKIKKTRHVPLVSKARHRWSQKERRVRVKAHLELIGRSERDWSQFPCVNQNRCFWASPWTRHKQAQLGLGRARGMRLIWFLLRQAPDPAPANQRSAH